MRKINQIVFLIFSIAALSSRVRAADEKNVMMDIYKELLVSESKGDYQKAVSYIHPDDVEEVKKVLGQIFDALSRSPVDQQKAFLNAITTAENLDQARAMSSRELMASFLAKQKRIEGVDWSEIGFDPIGIIQDKSGIAYMVYNLQTKEMDISISKAQVILFKKDGSVWKVLPKDQLDALRQIEVKVQEITNRMREKSKQP